MRLTEQMRREGKSLSDRRVIGLMVEDLFADYTREVIHSVYHAMPDGKDFRLVVMVGKYDDETYSDENKHAYRSICNSVYKVIEMCDIDGLILSLGSLNYVGESFLRSSVMKHYKDIPKVFISADLEGCVSVRYDNESGIREAINILVNIYGVKNICMLAGRDDNNDAIIRKQVFKKCLDERGLKYDDGSFVATDMSASSEKAAEQLLDQNPDAEAVFCVNDSVAMGLYNVMEKRGLEPGKDLLVFAFDNTHMAGELIPSLASIGSKQTTVGRRAMELLLDWMNGEPVTSELIPTMLYGRQSLEIDMYDFTTVDMQNVSDRAIYRMFNECFYRYRNENYLREDVNLKRLFFEIITRILDSLRRRYMSDEENEEICKLVDIFIENNALEYTDIRKLMVSIDRFQEGIRDIAEKSLSTNAMIDKIFLRLKNKMIYSLSQEKEKEARGIAFDRLRIQQFLAENTDYTGDNPKTIEDLIEGVGLLGMDNAALYLYEEPVRYENKEDTIFPETIRLKCVMKDGKLYIPSEERQVGLVRNMFVREELSLKCRGYIVLPIFHGVFIYGLIACELSENVFYKGEYIADQLGRIIHSFETDNWNDWDYSKYLSSSEDY